MLTRFKRSWYLFRASLYVLNQDRELLVFPLLSGVATLTVIATFVIPLIWSTGDSMGDASFPNWFAYMGLFFFYLTSYFITYYFNTAVISCAIYRMKGGNPDLKGGFRAANARLKHLFGWAMVSATLGIVLKHIQSRTQGISIWIVAAAGIAWSVASYLVIPIMVMEKMGPLDALKESGRLVKRTWGEQVVGNIGFGVFFSLILLPMFVIFPMLVLVDNVVWYFIGISITVVYVTLVSLVHSTLLSIFQAALYLYAREDFVPDGYERSFLRESVAKD
jgi:hypothetical protein